MHQTFMANECVTHWTKLGLEVLCWGWLGCTGLPKMMLRMALKMLTGCALMLHKIPKGKPVTRSSTTMTPKEK